VTEPRRDGAQPLGIRTTRSRLREERDSRRGSSSTERFQVALLIGLIQRTRVVLQVTRVYFRRSVLTEESGQSLIEESRVGRSCTDLSHAAQQLFIYGCTDTDSCDATILPWRCHTRSRKQTQRGSEQQSSRCWRTICARRGSNTLRSHPNVALSRDNVPKWWIVKKNRRVIS
jgi:hypothetical protein